MPRTKRVLIVGLDGADWRALQPAIDSGDMPVMARLQAEGSHGLLRSTTRPESSVAWSTFATGVNPGKHGVFGFVHHEPTSYRFTLADSRHVGTQPFWTYLGERGLRTGLVNVPFTYPPRPMNGFLIGGMLTPGAHVPFTHPPELQEELLARFDTYLFDSGDAAGQAPAALIDHVTAHTDQQLETALWLLRREMWSCFTVVFTALDRLQHFLWNEPAHRRHLRQLDDALAHLLAAIPDDTLVLLLSDHGFGGVENRFFINAWLAREGYLTLKRTPPLTSNLDRWLSALKQIPGVRRLKQLLLPAAWGPAQMKTSAFSRPIDWTKTRVYYAPDGGLRINLRGREPGGIVPPAAYEALRRELREKLAEVRDSRNGCAPIAAVFPREALYAGPFTSAAPDLIVEPRRDSDDPCENYLLDGKLERSATALFTGSAPYRGNHASDGMVLAWQPGVVLAQKLKRINLQDVAPTVLAALNAPVSDYMDGRVLLELFAPEHRPSPTYVATDVGTSPDAETDSAADEDMQAVEERLRNLGYLD